MSIRAAMEAIATRLETIQDLRTSPILPDQVNPPIAIVGVPPVTSYTEAIGRGKFNLAPTVTILVSANLDRKQLDLADYADLEGGSSIPAAFEADRTLGGVVEDCVVRSFRPLDMQEVGRIGYYGGVFALAVMLKQGEEP